MKKEREHYEQYWQEKYGANDNNDDDNDNDNDDNDDNDNDDDDPDYICLLCSERIEHRSRCGTIQCKYAMDRRKAV